MGPAEVKRQGSIKIGYFVSLCVHDTVCLGWVTAVKETVKQILINQTSSAIQQRSITSVMQVL